MGGDSRKVRGQISSCVFLIKWEVDVEEVKECAVVKVNADI